VRPVTISVDGEWWDSLLYMGRWYLVGLDGSVRVVDWNRLIDSWKLDDDLRLAMHCAFARSDSLYGDRWKLVFADPSVRACLQQKFEKLAKRRLIISKDQLEQYTVAHEDVGFAFPYSDAVTYALGLWVASPEGLEVADWDEDGRHLTAVGERVCDTPILSLSPNYGTIAMAAGDEGLFELSVDRRNRPPRQTLSTHCSSCDWLYYSVYASSHQAHGTLAAYTSTPAGVDEATGRKKYERVFQDAVDDRAIFGDSNGGYSWGSADKICKVDKNGIRVTRYAPGAREPSDQFVDAGQVKAPASALCPVDGSVAHYGIVVESDDALTVLRSDGKKYESRGAPTNWRTFQRSKWYVNHLHVIHSKRVDIVSFNHDFFVNQTSKIAGIRFRERGDPRPRVARR